MDDRSECRQETKPARTAERPAAAGGGVWALLAGIAASCTGVGAIVGVPLIIYGLAMPLARPASIAAGIRPHRTASQ